MCIVIEYLEATTEIYLRGMGWPPQLMLTVYLPGLSG